MREFNPILKFATNFSIYSLLIAMVVYAVDYYISSASLLSPNFWLMYGFIFFLTLIVFILSVIGLQKNTEIGTMTLLAGMVLKMIFSLSLFIFIRFKSDENLVILGLNFFSIYLLFTVFEVISLLRILRHQIKR